MNPDFPSRLAAQLRANPSLFEEMDDSLLGELVFHYAEGELSVEDAAEVASLLQTNPKAKAIYQRIEAADRFTASPAGKAWLDNLRAHVLPPLTDSPPPTSDPTFFDRLSEFYGRLSEWMAEQFPALSLQAGYSDGKTDEIIKKFPTVPGDPYEAQLVRDSVGRWFLRVFTKDAEAAKLKQRLEIEPEAPEMTFVAVEPAMFFAEVRLSESMAAALKSGHRPVFRPKE